MSLTDGTQEIAARHLDIAECMAFASQHAGKSYTAPPQVLRPIRRFRATV